MKSCHPSASAGESAKPHHQPRSSRRRSSRACRMSCSCLAPLLYWLVSSLSHSQSGEPRLADRSIIAWRHQRYRFLLLAIAFVPIPDCFSISSFGRQRLNQGFIVLRVVRVVAGYQVIVIEAVISISLFCQALQAYQSCRTLVVSCTVNPAHARARLHVVV